MSMRDVRSVHESKKFTSNPDPRAGPSRVRNHSVLLYFKFASLLSSPRKKCVRFGATHMLEESQDVDVPVPEEEAFEMYRVRADWIGLETHGSPATPVQYSNVQCSTKRRPASNMHGSMKRTIEKNANAK